VKSASNGNAPEGNASSIGVMERGAEGSLLRPGNEAIQQITQPLTGRVVPGMFAGIDTPSKGDDYSCEQRDTKSRSASNQEFAVVRAKNIVGIDGIWHPAV
jgi:hypothetical protein